MGPIQLQNIQAVGELVNGMRDFFMSSVHPFRFLFMNPNDLFSLADMLFTCLFHLRLLAISTPRYVCDSVSWRME